MGLIARIVDETSGRMQRGWDHFAKGRSGLRGRREDNGVASCCVDSGDGGEIVDANSGTYSVEGSSEEAGTLREEGHFASRRRAHVRGVGRLRRGRRRRGLRHSGRR
jgi:hypothetical protein